MFDLPAWSDLSRINERFLHDFATSSKLSSSAVSIIPSILFLSSSFILLYQHFHRYTSFYTRWKTRLYKDLLLHWSYFYITRVWFIFLKLAKYVLEVTSNIIKLNNKPEDAKFTISFLYSSIFLFVFVTSLIPVSILCLQQIYRQHIPNFLMWVAEDPWIRSEMGTSGHYLERPPRQVASPRQKAAYRSRRSSSLDNVLYFSKEYSFFRPCKSMITVSERSDFNSMFLK